MLTLSSARYNFFLQLSVGRKLIQIPINLQIYISLCILLCKLFQKQLYISHPSASVTKHTALHILTRHFFLRLQLTQLIQRSQEYCFGTRREGQMTYRHKNSSCRLYLHPWVDEKRQFIIQGLNNEEYSVGHFDFLLYDPWFHCESEGRQTKTSTKRTTNM